MFKNKYMNLEVSIFTLSIPGDSNDIQAAAMKYYPDLVQKMLLDTKLDHWVDAIAYIRSYKFTVDGMFDHSDCLYLLEAFGRFLTEFDPFLYLPRYLIVSDLNIFNMHLLRDFPFSLCEALLWLASSKFPIFFFPSFLSGVPKDIVKGFTCKTLLGSCKVQRG